MQIGNGGDAGPLIGKPAPGNILHHDNIFEDVRTPVTNCDSRPNRIVQFSAAMPRYMLAGSALRDVSFVHNTIATDNFDGPPGTGCVACAMIVCPKAEEANQSYNLIYRDNIADAGLYGRFAGNTNCGGPISAAQEAGKKAWEACFASYVLDYNIWTRAATTTWGFVGLGAHNILKIANMTGVRFVNYNNGVNGDYHLQSTSPGYRTASDGRDMGGRGCGECRNHRSRVDPDLVSKLRYRVYSWRTLTARLATQFKGLRPHTYCCHTSLICESAREARMHRESFPRQWRHTASHPRRRSLVLRRPLRRSESARAPCRNWRPVQ
jgi:hypothetical protein